MIILTKKSFLSYIYRKHLAATRDYTSITDELEGRLPNLLLEDRQDIKLPAIRNQIQINPLFNSISFIEREVLSLL